jgi:hypothetical protein
MLKSNYCVACTFQESTGSWSAKVLSLPGSNGWRRYPISISWMAELFMAMPHAPQPPLTSLSSGHEPNKTAGVGQFYQQERQVD